jgi:gamma-glutamyl hercynylcysteine S-oxide synthase
MTPAARIDLTARQTLLERLDEAVEQTDSLFDLVRPDSLYERPIPERHRIIFYLGHLEAFDWNLLRERILGFSTFQPDLDRLFAFGIDPVGGGLPTDKAGDWPSVDQVREYNQNTRHAIKSGLESILASGRAPGNDEADLPGLLNVAIEHRLMHAETLAYMLHQLPVERKIPKVKIPIEAARPAVHSMVEIPAGLATLGLSRHATAIFGWDNEYEEHHRMVPAFEISKYKVTNGEYLKFVNNGGYENKSLWAEDDWDWRLKHNISHPFFWKQMDSRWFWSAMFDEVPLPLDWPVYVSHAEANAYVRWIGKTLPTEAQWHRAAFGSLDGVEHAYPWGNEPPRPEHGNFDFTRWDPVPVGAFPKGHSHFGVADMLGNGWEWTSTLFEPFPGFQAFSFYPGYSANFFDGLHFVLKGGSPRTAACMLRRSFRNWFQPHYPYIYAAFRCVSN